MITIDHGGATLEGNATMSAIRAAAKALCTKKELTEFFERHGITDPTEEQDKMKWDAYSRDYEAAMKAARYLAHPSTPPKLRQEISSAVYELANITNVQVDHPAIVERSVTVMMEAIRNEDENVEDGAGRVRRYLLAMLDELPDLPKGGAE